MDPDKVSEWSRAQLLAYLKTRIDKSAGVLYKAAAIAELRTQTTETLRLIAGPALALQLEKQERRRQARLARKEQQSEHSH